jgi:aryl-alcohol dehydrogenase-like predicted oxidoreductase
LFLQKGVTTAIVGVKNPEQAEQNAGAVGWKISDDDLNNIANILGERSC